MELIEGRSADIGDELCGVSRVSGEARAGASLGIWGEEGCVGLDHDAIIGDELCCVGDFFGVFVSDDAGEGDHGAEVEDLLCFFWVAGETVEDESGWIEGRFFEDWDEIIECFSAMDDDWEIDVVVCFAGFDECKMGRKNRVLDGPDWFGVLVV